MMNSLYRWIKNSSALILLITLFSCGGGGGDSDSSGSGDGTPEAETFSVFEGGSTLLSLDLPDGDYEWEQLSGPQILIENPSLKEITITAPWVEDGPVATQFTVTAIIDGETMTETVDLDILDRRFITLRVENSDDTATNYFLNYISENDDVGVPDAATIQLTNVDSGMEVCGSRTSPNGQYLLYSIKASTGSLSEPCVGLYIVDIATLETTKISQLGIADEEIEVRSYDWSPDGEKIAYQGDHGEGIHQVYVIELDESATSYINYGNNSMIFTEWPSTDLFPVGAGGNPADLSLVEDTSFAPFSPMWLGNSNGLSFVVNDFDTFDGFAYQASVHGDARKLERNVLTFAEQFEILPQEYIDCPVDGICAVALSTPVLSAINREFVNPRNIETSIEGHMLFISTMLATNEASPIPVLALREPVIDNAPIRESTTIESVNVYDAAWSPVSTNLAYATEDDTRHGHSDDGSGLRIFGSEIPGQLYLFNDYELIHTEPHERLANPVPTIDENSVIALEWSFDGTHIAYARGEEGDEVDGGLFTSIWVTLVDDVVDQTSGTIDQNTVLLSIVDNTPLPGVDAIPDLYFRDFKWSTNGSGVLMLLKPISSGETTLRYVSRDGTETLDFDPLTDFNQATLDSVSAEFSPDGAYVAYIDEEEVGGDMIPAVFIQPVNGDDRIKVNVPIVDGGFIQSGLQWSPHGDAIIYTADSNADGIREYYLANVNGENQNLDFFIDVGSRILRVSVK